MSDSVFNPMLARIRRVDTSGWSQDPGMTGDPRPEPTVAEPPRIDPFIHELNGEGFWGGDTTSPLVAGRLVLPSDLAEQWGVPQPEKVDKFGTGNHYELYDDGTWYDYANGTYAPTPPSQEMDSGTIPPPRSRVTL